jgi:hypothetical protein
MKAIRIKSNAFCANVITRNEFRQLPTKFPHGHEFHHENFPQVPTNLPRCGKSWEQICSRFFTLGLCQGEMSVDPLCSQEERVNTKGAMSYAADYL